MKKFTLLIITLLLMIANLSAEDRQFYFVGKKERLGSISMLDHDKDGIYLRWDLIEGEMPSDIDVISLIRVDSDGNKTLLEVGANEVMSDANITQLYQESASQRRLFEIIDAIAHNDDPLCSNANLSNIGSKVSACLQDNYWSFLSSRVNFDIARARYRAYLDTEYDPNVANIEYILLAKNISTGQEFVLGKVNVDTTKYISVLPAKDFKQVITSKCNDNKYGLDDARVALYWKNGGDNSTEFFANGIMVSGYDLYYTTVTSTEFEALGVFESIEKVQIDKIAVTLPHDAKGNIDLSEYNLKKANDTLITLGEKDGESTLPVYVESKKELQERGFKPGEKRYYFLVPRDFTGNYGPTVFYEVVVPDLLPPVAPINPRVIEVDSKAELIWDAVNFQNYASYHQNDMKACTTLTVDPNSRVQFVDKDEMCTQDNGIVLNFNVSQYYVYRFDSASEAAGFEDLDLDGYNDVNESDDQKCSVSTNLAGLKYYLVATPNNDASDTIHFRDTTIQQGKVYWYRIVSVTPSKVISHLTAPIRAFIPKRELLDAPDINATYGVVTITTPLNENRDDLIVRDATGGRIDRVRLLILGRVYEIQLNNAEAKIFSEMKGVLYTREAQAALATIVFLKGDEEFAIRNFHLNDIFNFSSAKTDDGGDVYTIDSTKKYFLLEQENRRLEDGIAVDGGCIQVTFNESFLEDLDGKGCIETTISIGNNRFKRDVDCNITETKTICETSLNGEMVSIGIRKVMYTGITSLYSVVNYVPVITDLPVPNKPSLIDLELSKEDEKAGIIIRPQIQKVTGTIINLYKEDDKKRSFLKTVTHVGQNDLNQEINAVLEDLGVLEDDDVWCVRAKTIGLDGKTSPWSSLLCKEVTPNEEKLDILSWPALGSLEKDDDLLSLSFNERTKNIQILVGSATVSTETQPEVKDTDLTNVIAYDPIGASKYINVSFFMQDEVITNINIAKGVDGRYYLPGKDDDLSDPNLLEKITYITIIFITSEDKELFEEPVVLSGEGIVQMFPDTSNLGVVQQVELADVEVEGECSLIDTVNNLNRDYDYVVYRQTIDGAHKSNFVQITPLIESAQCNKETNTLDMSNNIEISTDGTTKIVNLIDKYPYIIGRTYKYVVIFFDKQSGEPVRYMLTTPDTIEAR